MGRAEELFEKILKKKEQAIEDFILNRKSEELFLDFKRSSDNGDSNKLSQNDRNNLAKAISGFGNSEGGVIVWGVDCSLDSDGADVAKTKIYIENPQRYTSWLNSAISGCTIPPHQGVKNEFILSSENQGFVITLIPKSNNTPHQMVGKLHYYIRAGSDFVPTPHDVLAGMFGRRPQPHICHQFLISPIEVYKETILAKIGIMLRNIGPGLASDVFLNCSFLDFPGKNCSIEFEQNDQNNWYGSFSLGRFLSLVSKSDLKLPPDAFWTPVTIHIKIAPQITNNLKINGVIGSSNGRSYTFEIGNTKEKLQEIYDECIWKYNQGKLDDLKDHYTEEIINSNYKGFTQ